MKKKNGFTLIELLAVIIILGIILLITISTIPNLIEDAKKKAFEVSVDNIVRSAELIFWNNNLKGEEKNLEYYYENSQAVDDELKFKGQKPKKGTILVNDKGEVAIALSNGVWCAIKDYDNDNITFEKILEEECVLEYVNSIEFIDVLLGGFPEIDKLFNELALSSNGDVYVKGYGHLGFSDDREYIDEFAKIPGLKDIKKIYTAKNLMFALSDTNDLYWWGEAGFHEENDFIDTPTILMSNVKELYIFESYGDDYDDSAFYIHTMDDQIYFMGKNQEGILSGNNEPERDWYLEPILINNLTNVKKIISSYWYHRDGGIYALLNDGTVKVWGYNLAGATPDGENYGKNYALTPKTIPNLNDVKDILGSSTSVFAVLNDGNIKAWGANSYNMLGIDENSYIETPALIPGLNNVKKIITGGEYLSVALQEDGKVLASGRGKNGIFGDGNEETNSIYFDQFTLLQVDNIKDITSDFRRLLYLKNDGSLYHSGIRYLDFDFNFNEYSVELPSGFEQYAGVANCITKNFSNVVHHLIINNLAYAPSYCFSNYQPFEVNIDLELALSSVQNSQQLIQGYLSNVENNLSNFNITEISKFGKVSKLQKHGIIVKDRVYNFIPYPAPLE